MLAGDGFTERGVRLDGPLMGLLGDLPVGIATEAKDRAAQAWLRTIPIGLSELKIGTDDRQHQLEELRQLEDLRRQAVATADVGEELLVVGLELREIVTLGDTPSHLAATPSIAELASP